MFFFLKETHELKVHQLVVQLEGWEQVSPVSVDKVGAFFREAKPARGAGKVSNEKFCSTTETWWFRFYDFD